MPSASESFEATNSGGQRFQPTHWTVIVSAKESRTPAANSAWENLCLTYWWPLYAFVRRRGYSEHDAQDLTQEFFVRLMTGNSLDAVDPSKGKFRSFLLAAMQHFLAKEWRRANAQKRGGGFHFISADAGVNETHYLQLPGNEKTPEQLFDQQWAMTLLERAVARLRDEFIAAGKGEQFEVTKVFLTGEKPSYAELAGRLGTTEAALKMSVSRMRHRYRELLRAEIADTVPPEEVEEELRALIAALN